MDEPKGEIMPPVELTQDEATLLQIAATGESMMPIGRWEKPIAVLVKKGLLHQHDKFNNVITAAGRQAVKQDEEKTCEKLAQALVTSSKAQLEKCVQVAVDQLVRAVQLTNQLKGDHPHFALEQWASVIFREAKDKLDG